jgi:SAM-dependent methyltransferase
MLNVASRTAAILDGGRVPPAVRRRPGVAGETGGVNPPASSARPPSGPPPGAVPTPAPSARLFTAGPVADDVDTGTVAYGPGIADESDLRLLGHLAGKRVVVLGAGAGAAAVALARGGTKVIAVDPSDEQLGYTRRLADREEVKVEVHHGDLADLAFLRADTVDAVLCVYVLGAVADVDRVFRQVHRILRTDAPFVLSVPHPSYRTVDPAGDPPTIVRRYLDRSPIGDAGDTPHTVSDLVTGLIRANFRIDTLLEPAPRSGGAASRDWAPAMAWMPSTLVVRARKEGT